MISSMWATQVAFLLLLALLSATSEGRGTTQKWIVRGAVEESVGRT